MTFLHSPYSGVVLVTALAFGLGAVAYWWPTR
jgi:hypothetical protein